MKVSIGIDVGKDGGIAVLHNGRHMASFATPQTKDGDIDTKALRNIIRDWIPIKAHELIIHVEDVHSIYGSSAKSNFQFGRSAGIIEGLLVGLGLEFKLVAPKAWQVFAWDGVELIKKQSKKNKMVNDTKAISIEAAKILFPDVCLLRNSRCSTPHTGIVDSLLIAAYGAANG
jgi:hypothetical protein